MRTLFGVTFRLEPNLPGSSDNGYPDVCELVTNWIATSYENRGKRSPQWLLTKPIDIGENDAKIEPLPNHLVQQSTWGSNSSRLREVVWQHPDDNDASAAWRTSIIIACHKGQLVFSLELRITSLEAIVKPIQYEVGCPKLVREVLGKYKCMVADWPIPSQVMTVNLSQVTHFVDETLLNRKRMLPVVLLSPDVWNGKYTVDATELADALVGLAEVVVLEDKWAAFQLTNRIGKLFSCYNGAIRIYWPGFSLSDDCYTHKLYFPSAIKFNEDQQRPFKKHLFRMLSTISAHRFTEGSIIPAVRSDIRQAALQQQHDLKIRIQEGGKELDELQSNLLESLSQIENLQKIIDNQQSDIKKLRDENDALLRNWKTYTDYSDGDAPQSPESEQIDESIKNVADVVLLAMERFSNTLVFHDHAIRQAKSSPYKNPDRVLDLFVALNEIVETWRAKGKLDTAWKLYFTKRNIPYKPNISMTSSGKYGEDYTFTHNGHEIHAGEHVTWGRGQDPQECLSVHWWRDEESKRLVICRCGKHGTNTKT